MALKFSYDYAKAYVNEEEIKNIAPAVLAAHDSLNEKSGLGNDFLNCFSA